MNNTFDYDTAFSRNIGWFSEDEQQTLKEKSVAIAGCGGVGGVHALTLARLGISKFHMADFDDFGIENFNRQVGANMNTLGRKKLDVMEEMVTDINPDAAITSFPEGVHDGCMDEFLDGIDLYVDSLDFFALPARIAVFKACYEKNIPALTAAPLGLGTAFLSFMPGKMSFEEYFGMDGCSLDEQYLRFYLGLAPSAMHAQYLVDPSKLNLKEKRGPSTIGGCTMSAGVIAANAVKVLLDRGEVVCAPDGLHWDPYMNRMERTSIQNGHKDPSFLTRLKEAKILFNIS